MEHAFVIPSYSTAENKCVVDCVKSIRKFHAFDSKIIIVDSDSPDKSYFKDLQPYNVHLRAVQNKFRETGAIWHAYDNFPEVEFFFFLQDSLVCNKNVLKLTEHTFSCLRYFPSWDGKGFRSNSQDGERKCGWADDDNNNNDGLNFVYKDPNGLDDRNWLQKNFNLHTNYVIPEEWDSVFGSIFFCHRSLLDKLVTRGFNKILPTNKMEACAMERAWGIVMKEEGINVRQKSIQKYYLDPLYNPSLFFEKNFYLR